jgi:cysteinyl-tRNA synthetase
MERAGGRELHLYDTLTRQIKPVTVSNGKQVRIYCCGPTVYRDAHVGNLRTFLLSDLVTRTLKFSGYEVDLVQNITDVGHMSEDFEEDKILAQSKSEKRDPFEIARDYEARFHKDCAALGITKARLYPRASECIDLMIEFISKLMDMGFAYRGSDGSIYFDAEKAIDYGGLSGNKLDALKPGHRYEYEEEGAKRFHADWALWKAAGNRKEMIWQTPWGAGFPGWHIECSAMSLKYLNNHVDLHIGGIDLRFPHHENERAQSNPMVSGEAVSNWLHGEHLLFEGRKMSKSSGNVVLVKDLIERGIDPLALRFCFMANRYRSQMDLSWDSLKAGHNFLARLRKTYATSSKIDPSETKQVSEFVESVVHDFRNDLDTPKAMLKLRTLERLEISDREKRAIFENLEPLLGLDLLSLRPTRSLPDSAVKLLEERKAARAAKDFNLSDSLRDQLAEFGVNVQDTASGQEWSWSIDL